MKTSGSEARFEVVGVRLPADRLGRRRTDPVHREGLLKEYDASGLSGAEFARRSGVNYSTFTGWLYNRSKASPTKTTQTTKVPTETPKDVFRELMVAPPKGPAPARLTVTLPGGVKVEGCDAATAVELARLMKGGR